MNRYDFYFQQLVLSSELDEAWDAAEQADHNLVLDQAIVGINSGLNVLEAAVPNLTVQVSIGRAYDQMGQRVFNPATQIVDLSGSIPVGPGNQRYASVFNLLDS